MTETMVLLGVAVAHRDRGDRTGADYDEFGMLADSLRPQRWVIASFEHHCGPHGLPRPHIHNIVTRLTAKSKAAEMTMAIR